MSSPEETALADMLRDLTDSPPVALDADGVAAIERRGRRRLRRGLALRALAGVAVIGLVTAGALSAAARSRTDLATTGSAVAGSAIAGAPISGSGTTGASTPVTGTTHTGATRMVGYVQQQIETAPNPADSLLEVTQTASDTPGAATVWTDPATGNTMIVNGSGQDKQVYWQHDYYKNKVLNEDGTQVNYGPRTWWNYDVLVGGPVSGPVPSGPADTNYFTPAEFKADLARPGWKIIGYPTIDGHSTVEISFAAAGLTNDIWADARTYEVVRTLRKLPKLGAITQDYYWVPRTTALSTLINHPDIPAGFRQVPGDLAHRRLRRGR
jgi:hypothetical protein